MAENNPLILEFDDFANRCGCFYNAAYNDGPNINNGYNCSHPDQEEVEEDEDTGEEIGCCHCFSCPLGYKASLEELVQYSVIERDPGDDSDPDYDYIVVTDPEILARLRQNGETGLVCGQ